MEICVNQYKTAIWITKFKWEGNDFDSYVFSGKYSVRYLHSLRNRNSSRFEIHLFEKYLPNPTWLYIKVCLQSKGKQRNIVKKKNSFGALFFFFFLLTCRFFHRSWTNFQWIFGIFKTVLGHFLINHVKEELLFF